MAKKKNKDLEEYMNIKCIELRFDQVVELGENFLLLNLGNVIAKVNKAHINDRMFSKLKSLSDYELSK